jgi:predicted membrane-bound mannosyltransferase
MVALPLLQVLLMFAAAGPAKPVCNAASVGRMWPDAANDNPRMVMKLSRCGELQVCTRGAWHYRWKSPTVTIDQLREGAKRRRPASCEASTDSGVVGNAPSQVAPK